MDKFGKSQPITRLEDQRFLTGFGKYIDDIAPADALHAFVFRSPIAHGVITNLDVSDARESEGVAAVITAADLIAAGISVSLSEYPITANRAAKTVKSNSICRSENIPTTIITS